MLIRVNNEIVNTDLISYAHLEEDSEGATLHLHCLGRYGNGEPIVVIFGGGDAREVWEILCNEAKADGVSLTKPTSE